MPTVAEYTSIILSTEAQVREWKRRRKALVLREMVKKQHEDPAWVAHFRARRAEARNDPEKAARHVSAARLAALAQWDRRGRLPDMTPGQRWQYRKLKQAIGKEAALARLFPSTGVSPRVPPVPREGARPVQNPAGQDAR